MTDLDRLTAIAVDELARRIKDRGDADAEFIAREFILWMRTHGWRPTEAGPLPAWNRPHGVGGEPTADYLTARRALDEQLAARHDDAGSPA